MRITESARRHGVEDDDMRHALRNRVRAYAAQGDHELLMVIGPSRTGVMLEIGVDDDEEDPRIVHAMKARSKFWP